MGIPESVIPVRALSHEFRLAGWFRDAGDDMLLFVHGLGCSKENFRDAWQRPEFRGWSLLAIDLPGFGRSPRPAGFTCGLEDHARVLAAVIDTQASRRIHLVAHSMGGTLALLMPARALSCLESLVLVEARMKQASSSVARAVSALDFEQFQSEFLPAFKRRSASDPRAAFDAERADPDGFYRSAQSMSRWLASGEMVDRYMSVRCPKVFIYGSDNQHLAELQALPAADRCGIQDAAHFVMRDNVDGFYGFLGSWLDRHQ